MSVGQPSGPADELQWRQGDGGCRTAMLPPVHPLYGAVSRFVIDGGGKAGAAARLDIRSIELTWSDDLAQQFDIGVRTLERQRQQAFFHANLEDDGQKARLLLRLKYWMTRSKEALAQVLGEPQGLARANVLLATHGTTADKLGSICSLGAKDLRMTDPGFAGAGIYTTAQSEYSEAYAGDDDGEHVMLLCWVAVGLTYPISRATDYVAAERNVFGTEEAPVHSTFYDKGGNGIALKSKFDSHLFCVTQPTDFSAQGCFCAMPDDEPDFDELVVKEGWQVRLVN
jgi:hypothetical protein